jgi:hypothetical protein
VKTGFGGSCISGVLEPHAALTLVIAALVRIRFSSRERVRMLDTNSSSLRASLHWEDAPSCSGAGAFALRACC